MKEINLPPSVIKLEHYQIPGGEHRGNYLVGLAVDCFMNPENDRNSHYLARELMWTGRPKSAIKEFERHIVFNAWPAERAQSMIFIGDAFGMLNNPEKQIEWYNRGFYTDPNRRESLIKIAEFYKHNNNPRAVLVYATAALQIPWTDYYANNKSHYENYPYELLYWAAGWTGDISGAQNYILKALRYQPNNPDYLRDTKYYFEYADRGISGYMHTDELQWLYETSKKMDSVCEIGSWKGRSTDAILTGCKGSVTAIDNWEGSKETGDETYTVAKQEDVYATFMKNVGHFKNLTVHKSYSVPAADKYPDKSFDMVFIDGDHSYEQCSADIRAWKNKAKILLCGHDYTHEWPSVMRAVDEELGGPDGVGGYSIWYRWINQPSVSIIIPTLGRPEKLHRLLTLIKQNAGYSNYEVIVKTDDFPPNNIGVPKLLKQGVEESKGDLIMYLGNDCMPEKDFLQLAVFRMIKEFPDLDGLVGLNDGYWKGEFFTHFLASKKLLPMLDGEFFHTGYFHCGCDNELFSRCNKIGKAVWAEESKVYHDHPVQTGFKPQDVDDVYKLAYRKDRMEHDKNLLHERSELLGFALKENFTYPKEK